MKILVLNDIHHGETRVSTSHPGVIRQPNSQSLEKLAELVEELSDHAFDLVIQLGDLVREIGDRNHDKILLKEALQPFSRLPFPVLHSLGNHELNIFSVEELENIFAEANHDPAFSGVHQSENLQIALA